VPRLVHIVDDDASFATAMERRLKLAGYEVATQRAFARHEVSCNLQEKLEPVRARIRKLTPRERQVFDLVIRGKQNKQIRGKCGEIRAIWCALSKNKSSIKAPRIGKTLNHTSNKFNRS
jgi:FixJ family two-component response regulator